MPHKPETLKRIVALLEQEYPPAVFRYELDTKRFMGSRIAPDVQVFTPGDQKPVCVVEVGYTRPEKLHHYKQAGIADVRWYGRDDGKLYSYGDVQPITHKVKIEYDFRPDPRDTWHSVCWAHELPCPAVFDALSKLHEDLQQISKPYAKLRLIAKRLLENRDLRSHELHDDGDEKRTLANMLLAPDYSFGSYECPAYLDFVGESEELRSDVFVTLWSNGHGVIPEVYCDWCDEHRVILSTDGSAWLDGIMQDFSSYEDFLYRSQRQVLSLVKSGVSVGEAEKAHRKTAPELVKHVVKIGASPLVFSDATEHCCLWLREAA